MMFAQKTEKKRTDTERHSKSQPLPKRIQEEWNTLWIGNNDKLIQRKYKFGIDPQRNMAPYYHDILEKDDVIQREVVRHKPLMITGEIRWFEQRANEIDRILQVAYSELCHGRLDDVPQGYRELYLLRKNHYDEGIHDIHPSTAAGYVIESKVNNKIRGTSYMILQSEDTVEHSRPDIVLLHEGLKGLLDITASNSKGHILKKGGNWLGHIGFPYVAELTYPSINFSNMKPIQLSLEEKERLQARVAYSALLEEEWRHYCETNFEENQKLVLNALKKKKMRKPKCTSRQWESLCLKFGWFGIQLYCVKSYICGTVIENFLENDKILQYIPDEANRLARELKRGINSGELVGMGSEYCVWRKTRIGDKKQRRVEERQARPMVPTHLRRGKKANSGSY